MMISSEEKATSKSEVGKHLCPDMLTNRPQNVHVIVHILITVLAMVVLKYAITDSDHLEHGGILHASNKRSLDRLSVLEKKVDDLLAATLRIDNRKQLEVHEHRTLAGEPFKSALVKPNAVGAHLKVLEGKHLQYHNTLQNTIPKKSGKPIGQGVPSTPFIALPSSQIVVDQTTVIPYDPVPFVQPGTTADQMTDAKAEAMYYDSVTRKQVTCSKMPRIGNKGDGGWEICASKPFTPGSNCLVYSFGINYDFSFDDGMAGSYGCEVHSFDPSMKLDDHLHKPNVHFHKLGIGKENIVTKDGWKLETLKTIMTDLNHLNETLDILKMDVEFSEWGSLESILKDGILSNVRQIMFEVHTSQLFTRPSTKMEYEEWYTLLYALEMQGFRKFHSHGNPYGVYTSPSSHMRRHCCHEIYYINLKYM